MSLVTQKRDFLSISDFSTDELTRLLNRAHRLKVGKDDSQLIGKSLAMIFRKSSTR
ncbi:MAG TPA: ornithine carbamoyltransferase, partial [Gemmatimonadetes bacterium]|nr:ornithine carbamoyltransferase [Gemmatimonadota bacterium]